MPAQSLPTEAWWIPCRPFSTTNEVSTKYDADEHRQDERVPPRQQHEERGRRESRRASAAQRTWSTWIQ